MIYMAVITDINEIQCSSKKCRAIAEYLSKDLPYQLSPDDVFVTAGCAQAIDIVITALARPDANILLPRPGFPMYEARCTFNHVEMRHFDLIQLYYYC